MTEGLRNSIDYAGGGTITVQHIGASVHVLVANEGPGIPAADR
ncbi:hypothetical protein [Sphingomonas sp. PP-CC-3A-396]|jgi:signal transduction histidine kinase|nr:hypothetical protein [Sphingomonas sp. PP-CC-3A-396]TCQ02701.1 hypothetical protein C8J40_1158 [Sphingomonas sp. PP-CC-3A-396]